MKSKRATDRSKARIAIAALSLFMTSCRHEERPSVPLRLDSSKGTTHEQTILDSEQRVHWRRDSALTNTYDIPTSTLGIGIVSALDHGEEIELYNDSLLKDKFYFWSEQSSKDDSAAQERSEIGAKYCMTDLSVADYVCLKKTAFAYQVQHNFDGVKYLPRTKGYSFKTWSEYILESYGIRLGTYDTGRIEFRQPIRKRASLTSDTVVLPPHDERFEEFCPIELKGDWLKVQYNCFSDPNDSNSMQFEGLYCHDYIHQCKNPLIGYIQWKRDNQVLIDMFLRP